MKEKEKENLVMTTVRLPVGSGRRGGVPDRPGGPAGEGKNETKNIKKVGQSGQGGNMTTYDLPSISTKDYWVSVTDVPCPVCKGGVLRWAESGYVPGYRICDRCGRHFRADGSRERPAVIEEENQGGWLADQLMEYRRTLDAKLKSYGAVLIQSDGRLVCEMTDPVHPGNHARSRDLKASILFWMR